MPHETVPPGAEGGFVRFPRSFATLPVSPGAKCVLLHLCSAADDDGESWYSYEDIAALVGRSKASVTAYVRELVDLGLVEAIRQTMANGYNYRRRLRIVGWRDIVAYWSRRSRSIAATRKRKASRPAPVPAPSSTASTAPAGTCRPETAAPSPAETPPVAEATVANGSSSRDATSEDRVVAPNIPGQDTECSVQRAECPDPTGLITNNHQTKTPRRPMRTPPAKTGLSWSREDEAQWRFSRPSDRDPISIVHAPIPEQLGNRITAAAEELARRLGILDSTEVKRRALPWLNSFVARHRLKVSIEEIETAAEALASIADTESGFEAVTQAMEAGWKPHWRHLSSATQIKALAPTARSAPGAPSPQDRERLSMFRNRAWVVRFHQLGTARRASRPAHHCDRDLVQ